MGLQDRLKVGAEQQQQHGGYEDNELPTALGPLEPYLRDTPVTEIMVNGPNQVYVERAGKLEMTITSFLDDAHLLRIIDKIVSPIGRRIDEASPMVDARLPDGSRVNAII